MKIITFLLFCHVVSAAEKHYLELKYLLNFGIPNAPEFAVSGLVDGVLLLNFDNIQTKPIFTHDWMKELLKDHSEGWTAFYERYVNQKELFIADTSAFKNVSRQTNVTIVQQIARCEYKAKDIILYVIIPTGHLKYGYNGEDFIAYKTNCTNQNWTALDPRAEVIIKLWEKNKDRNRFWDSFLCGDCVRALIQVREYGGTNLAKRGLPMISLLQKTPSSPVTCFATGFYPEEAIIFWMKDGEKIHEGVDFGEILPNSDGSFQVSSDLEVSLIPSEEWTKYKCVFQFSGVQNGIITKLSKSLVQSNLERSEVTISVIRIAIIATVAVAITIVLIALGIYTVKKENETTALESTTLTSPDNISM